jgi:hypothetical protein
MLAWQTAKAEPELQVAGDFIICDEAIFAIDLRDSSYIKLVFAKDKYTKDMMIVFKAEDPHCITDKMIIFSAKKKRNDLKLQGHNADNCTGTIIVKLTPTDISKLLVYSYEAVGMTTIGGAVAGALIDDDNVKIRNIIRLLLESNL